MRRPASFLIGVLALAACQSTPAETPIPCPTAAPTRTGAQAILEDARFATVTVGGAVEGEFRMELYGDAAPIATASFVSLARCNFYDGIWFHRIVAGFVIQAGDPQTRGRTGDFEGMGQGGPGYEFEIEPPADGLRYDPYVVAMANDEVANGSQFFVTLADLDAHLRAVGAYTIFGAVTDGTDVIDAIAQVPVADPQFGAPLQLVTIEDIAISGEPDASPAE
jgi:cyclophilin family peptidyl-prolyl cis-trans isomerase